MANKRLVVSQKKEPYLTPKIFNTRLENYCASLIHKLPNIFLMESTNLRLKTRGDQRPGNSCLLLTIALSKRILRKIYVISDEIGLITCVSNLHNYFQPLLQPYLVDFGIKLKIRSARFKKKKEKEHGSLW